MNQGFIKLHRKIKDSPLWKDLNSKQRDIFINLLMMANHNESTWIFEGIEYKLKPGQMITSLESIKKECAKDVSIQNIRTCLLKLEKYGFLTNKSTNKNRLITIANWELYQVGKKNQQTNQQATNKQLTTNNNVKNDKNKNIYVETSNEYRLAKYLFELIRKNNPTHKEPNLQDWAKHIDYMIRIDKRKVEGIEAMIRWCQQDDFWYKNILSTKKLRERYDQLYLQMKPMSQNYAEEPKGKVLDFKIGGE